MNLDVPSGSMTAVVGASGSGKSTIGSLLLRLYDPDCGQVSIGNYDVKKLDPTWLRKYIGTVNQVGLFLAKKINSNDSQNLFDDTGVILNVVFYENHIHESGKLTKAYTYP